MPSRSDTAESHNALAYARAHLKTHMQWRSYLNAGGELPHEKVGDIAHQEQAIEELNTICAALRERDSLAAERDRLAQELEETKRAWHERYVYADQARMAAVAERDRYKEAIEYVVRCITSSTPVSLSLLRSKALDEDDPVFPRLQGADPEPSSSESSHDSWRSDEEAQALIDAIESPPDPHRERLTHALGHIQTVAGRFMQRGHAGFEYEGISDELALTLQELSLIRRTAETALQDPPTDTEGNGEQ